MFTPMCIELYQFQAVVDGEMKVPRLVIPYLQEYCINDLLTELLGPYQEIRSPIFFVRGPCVKVRASYF